MPVVQQRVGLLAGQIEVGRGVWSARCALLEHAAKFEARAGDGPGHSKSRRIGWAAWANGLPS
jgi:hypothetical protein